MILNFLSQCIRTISRRGLQLVTLSWPPRSHALGSCVSYAGAPRRSKRRWSE